MKVIDLMLASAFAGIGLLWAVFGILTVVGIDTGLDVEGPMAWLMVALGLMFGGLMGAAARNKWRDIREARQERVNPPRT